MIKIEIDQNIGRKVHLCKRYQILQSQDTFLIITIPRNLIKLLVICFIFKCSKHVMSCRVNPLISQSYLIFFLFFCSKKKKKKNLISFSSFNTVLVEIRIKLDTALSHLSNGKCLHTCVLIVYSQERH